MTTEALDVDVADLLQRIEAADVELHLWMGEVRVAGARFPDDLLRSFEGAKERLKALLVRRYDRVRTQEGRHDWIWYRAPGLKPSASCGHVEWCQRFMRAVQLFATRTQIRRWVRLDQGHLHLERVDGGWQARLLGWPEGYGPAPSVASEKVARVLSVCETCAPVPVLPGEKDGDAEPGQDASS